MFALSRLVEREQAVVRVEPGWGGEQALLSCLPGLRRLSRLDIPGSHPQCIATWCRITISVSTCKAVTSQAALLATTENI